MQEVPNSIRGQVSVSNYKMKTTSREVIFFPRLVWTLPGKTKIVCHLKDKKKIRNKKRFGFTNISTKIMELKSYLILVHFGTPPHYLGQ